MGARKRKSVDNLYIERLDYNVNISYIQSIADQRRDTRLSSGNTKNRNAFSINFMHAGIYIIDTYNSLTILKHNPNDCLCEK